MKKLIVFCAIFSTFLITTGYAKTNPKFVLGDKVCLLDKGWYRNCSFPAFVENAEYRGDSQMVPWIYEVSFDCPARWEGTQTITTKLYENELYLATNGKCIVTKAK